VTFIGEGRICVLWKVTETAMENGVYNMACITRNGTIVREEITHKSRVLISRLECSLLPRDKLIPWQAPDT
jgi:hypothetical protein